MKVLMFGWEFPPFITGGLGTVCQALTSHMADKNVDVLFVLPKAVGQEQRRHNFELRGADEVRLSHSINRLYEELSRKTVSFLHVDAFLEPYWNETAYSERRTQFTEQSRLLQQLSEQNSLSQLDFHGGYGQDLLQEVSRYALIGASLGYTERFDVIHAHDWMTYLAGVEAKRTSGKPLVCHVHATEFDRTGDNPNPHIYEIERYGLHAADKVLAVSQRTRSMLIERYGLPPGKVAVVYNAVSKIKQIERAKVKRHLKEKIVLFLGRVTLQKGPDYFVEATRLVLKERDDVRFVMAGSGDMLYRLIERVAAGRLQKNFHFTGFLFGPEVEEMFAMSDLYVMPSVSEPFGITPYEAMLYHVPTIVSKQSGIAEVLKHALKVDFWDVQKLAGTISEVLSDDKYAARLAEQGARELDAVSWDTAVEKIIGHYREVTS